MRGRILFNTKGYDGFIDFIKAYAILCVIFGHTFEFALDKVGYGLWAGMQVPLFILIQVFHYYKKNNNRFYLWKILKRVMIPFFVLEIITFLLAYYVGYNDTRTLVRTALCGGYGPGSYYPWVYIQIASMLPLFALILTNFDNKTSLVIFLLICEFTEIFFSIIDLPEALYRLLAMRYIFLIYLGWLWVKEGILVNYITIILSLISLSSVVYFEYFSVSDEPYFFSTGFKFHRWPCYFYVSYGLTVLLHILWSKFDRYFYFQKAYKFLAAASYEIFLVQMSLFYFIKPDSFLSFIPSYTLRFLIWAVVLCFLSIAMGGCLNNVLHPHKDISIH